MVSPQNGQTAMLSLTTSLHLTHGKVRGWANICLSPLARDSTFTCGVDQYRTGSDTERAHLTNFRVRITGRIVHEHVRSRFQKLSAVATVPGSVSDETAAPSRPRTTWTRPRCVL